MSEGSIRGDRGLSIWPFILIAIGVVWLLGEAGVLSSANFAVLFRLWPILLIGVGLELLVGRRSRALSMLVGLATVVTLVVLMLVGPSIGLASSAEVKSIEYATEPLPDATDARVTVSVDVGNLEIVPLRDSADFIQANLRYVGEVTFDATQAGSTQVVELDNDYNGNAVGFLFLPFFNNSENLSWDVAISDNKPLDLNVNTGTGGATLDLGDFALTNLTVTSGTGGITATLPNVEGERYDAVISTGTGGITVTIEDDAALSLRVNTGTGGATIDVPDGAAVRLQGDVGTGGITVPASLQRVGGDDDNFIGESGVWETPDYASASRQIAITFSGGTGGLTLR